MHGRSCRSHPIARDANIIIACSSSRSAIARSTVPAFASRCYATGSEPSGNMSPASDPTPPPPASAASSSSSPATSSSPSSADAKISSIVDQIEQLTLLQAADLVSQLKVRRHQSEGRDNLLQRN